MEEKSSCGNVYGCNMITPGTDEIRLLEILPSDEDDTHTPIRGRFKICSLQNSLPYDALSYMWSDPKSMTPIHIEDNPNFQIPKRLAVALRDIRYLRFARFMWIDAICINQADTSERNHQVQLMRAIYEHAQVVRIWLDLTLDPSDPALNKLSSFGENASIEDLQGGAEQRFWRQVNKIKQSQYWGRMWIQQEISATKRVTLHCRRLEISISGLVHHHRLSRDWLRQRNASAVEGLEIPFNYPLRRAVNLLSRRKSDSKPSEVPQNPFFGLHQYHMIFGALRMCRPLQATDPRDKVFALAGAIRSWQELPFTVDYQLSTAQVFTQIAKHIIFRWMSVDFLRDINLGDADPSHNLPSWLPDYSSPSSTGTFQTPPENMPVSLQYSVPPEFCGDERILRIQGYRIDRILVPYWQLSFHNVLYGLSAGEAFARFKDIITTALELHQNAGILGPSEMTDAITEARIVEQLAVLLKALIGESEYLKRDGREYLSEFTRQFIFLDYIASQRRSFNSSFSDLLRLHDNEFCKDPSEFELLLISRLDGRCLYLSEKGVIGLAPFTCLPTDEIWCIPGCRCPLILRPEDDHYLVVGPAFHEGLHDGTDVLLGPDLKRRDGESESLVEGLSWENRYGKYEIQTIALY